MLRTAQEEADVIRSDAEKSVAERRRGLERRIAEIRGAAEQRVEEEIRSLDGRTEATVALLMKRARLRLEDRIYHAVDLRAREECRGLRSAPGYADIMRAWIVEAARGLEAAQADVLCPPEDREAVRQALPAAMDELRRDRGQEIALRLADAPVSGQGVVLRNSPPTVAFSNTVDDRMRRFAGRMREIVFRTLIEENDG